MNPFALEATNPLLSWTWRLPVLTRLFSFFDDCINQVSKGKLSTVRLDAKDGPGGTSKGRSKHFSNINV